jgi:putative flippase GtrA
MKPEPLKLLRFIVSGVVAAGVYYFALSALLSSGVHPLIGGALAYIAAMPVSFSLHKIFTFRSKDRFSNEAPRFVLASIVGIAVASVTPALLLHQTSMSKHVASVITCILTPLMTYLLLNTWVFRGAQHD